MNRSVHDTREVAILGRILEPDNSPLSTEAARAILALDFTLEDKERMRQLSAKAREGSLSSKEQAEIDNYELAGHVLNIMRSRARKALKQQHGNPGKSSA